MKISRLAIVLALTGMMALFGSFAFAQNAGAPALSGTTDRMDEETAEKVAQLRAEKAAMHAEITALLAANADATDEEKEALVAEWRVDNQERLQTQRDRITEIRDSMKTEFKAALRERMQSKKEAARKRIQERLADMTDEERQAAKEDVKEKFQDRLRQEGP